jgi:hypothetical protein
MVHAPEDAMAPPRWPSDLEAVLAHARLHRCDYVLFDADAPRIDGLAWFEEDGA